MNILEKSIRAIGGVFNERLLAYFKNYGANSNVLQDAEKEYLRGKGLTFGANQDAWKQLDSKYEDIIPLEVSDILKKYNATMLLPGVSGAMRFGYQPGNYRESTGQTLAVADQQVGLVVDAARVPGPELAVTAAIGVGGGFVNNGDGSYTKPVGVEGSLAINGNSVPSGNYVRFRFEVVSLTGNITPYVGGAIQSTITSVGPKEINAQSGASIITEASIYCSAANSVTVRAISVRELPGIHASQSTSGFQPVLRNTAGIQSWQFDGSDDRLSLSAVPFQMAEDHFVVVGCAKSTNKWQVVCTPAGNSSSISRAGAIIFSDTGIPAASWVNDAGVQTNINGTEALENGISAVLSATKGADLRLRVNGILKATAASPPGTFSFNAGHVGFASWSGPVWLSGHIHGVIFGKGAITDSELLTLERFVASLQGRAI